MVVLSELARASKLLFWLLHPIRKSDSTFLTLTCSLSAASRTNKVHCKILSLTFRFLLGGKEEGGLRPAFFYVVIPDSMSPRTLLRKRNTLRLNHAKMQAFCRGTRLVCFSGAGSPFTITLAVALQFAFRAFRPRRASFAKTPLLRGNWHLVCGGLRSSRTFRLA